MPPTETPSLDPWHDKQRRLRDLRQALGHAAEVLPLLGGGHEATQGLLRRLSEEADLQVLEMTLEVQEADARATAARVAERRGYLRGDAITTQLRR